MQSRLFGDDLHKLYPIIADGQSRLGVPRQRARVPRARRSLAPARDGDAHPRGVGGQPAHGPRSPRVLRVPLGDDGAVGRARARRVHRRARHRRDARPQRAPSRRATSSPTTTSSCSPPRRARSTCRRSASSSKGRIKPGSMFLVDTVRGRVIEDEEIKRDLAARRPYRAWVTANRVGLDELPEPISIAQPDPRDAARSSRRRSATRSEELSMVLTPMAVNGEEPVGLDGHRHAARRAVARAAAALQLLQAAVRAGHQPADRSDPRAARHVARRSTSVRAPTCSASGPSTRAASACAARSSRTRSSRRSAWRARGRPALPLHDAARALPRRRRGARRCTSRSSRSAGRRRRPCTRGTRCSCSATAASTPTGRRSPRCSPPRPCTTTSCARACAPRSASSSRRARRAT